MMQLGDQTTRRQSSHQWKKPTFCLLDAALAHLNDLIAKGKEYPEAQYAASVAFCVDYQALGEAYDAQF